MDRTGDIKVIPLLCPACGSRLPSEEEDVIFVCLSCNASWELVDGSLTMRELRHAEGSGDLLIPFWILPFRVTTREGVVASRGGFRNLTGSLPSGGGDGEDSPPLLFVPACAFLSPPQLVRAGRLITLRQPPLSFIERRDVRVAPIVFREDDARNMGEIILLSTVTEARKKSYTFLESFSFHPGKAILCTIPFTRQGAKLFHSAMNLEL